MAKKGDDAPKGRKKETRKMVVRVMGTDLDGEKKIVNAITGIKGVSHSFANALCKAAKIDVERKLGSFTENEIEELENHIKNPKDLALPKWLFNRRKDIETGEDLHVSGTDVDVARKFDVQRMVDKRTYKGIRHMLGLPVRGQRTRSSFRRGKTVGVIRKSVRITMEKSGGKRKKKE